MWKFSLLLWARLFAFKIYWPLTYQTMEWNSCRLSMQHPLISPKFFSNNYNFWKRSNYGVKNKNATTEFFQHIIYLHLIPTYNHCFVWCCGRPSYSLLHSSDFSWRPMSIFWPAIYYRLVIFCLNCRFKGLRLV
jgi:hypothetical protein